VNRGVFHTEFAKKIYIYIFFISSPYVSKTYLQKLSEFMKYRDGAGVHGGESLHFERPGVPNPVWARISLFPKNLLDCSWGQQNLLYNVYRGYLQMLRWPGSGVDNPPLSTAEIESG